MTDKHVGSTFDNFLEEEGLLGDVQAEAIKRVIAWQIQEYMEKNAIHKTAFAKLMSTSRSQLDRLLDPCNVNVKLSTLTHAAEAMGKRLEFRLI